MKNNKKNWFLNLIMIFMIIFIFVFNYQENGYGPKITNLFILTFIFFNIIEIIRSNEIMTTKDLFPLIVFLIVCIISCLYTPSLGESLTKVKTLIILTLFIICMFNYIQKNDKSLILIIKWYVYASIITSVYLILCSNWQMGIRANQIAGDANQTGAYLSYAIVFIYYLIKNKNINQVIGIVGALLIVFANVIGGSRSALISSLIGILLIVFLGMKRNKKIVFKFFGILILLFILGNCFYNIIMHNEVLYKLIGSRFVSFFEITSGHKSSINETSTQTRMLFIQLATNLFSKNYFTIMLGNGVGSFAYFNNLTYGVRAFCHNNFFELLSCVGIVGFISYYYIYFKLLFKNIKKSFVDHLLKSSVIIVILIQIFIMHFFVVFYYQKLEYLIIIILICLNKELNKEKIEKG